MEDSFYETLRNWIIVLVVGISVFIACFTTLYNFTKSQSRYKWQTKDFEEELPPPASVVFVSETLALASSVCLTLLIGFTVLVAPVIPNLANTTYWSWVNSALLDFMWCATLCGAYFIIFGILPFSYFYSETDSNDGLFKRARESVITLGLVYSAGCFAAVLLLLLVTSDSQKQHFFYSASEVFLSFSRFFAPRAGTANALSEFTEWLISKLELFFVLEQAPLHADSTSRSVSRVSSYFSLFEVKNVEIFRFNWPLTAVLHLAMGVWYLIAIPRGLSALFSLLKAIPVSLNYQMRLKNQIEELDFEIVHLNTKIELIEANFKASSISQPKSLAENYSKIVFGQAARKSSVSAALKSTQTPHSSNELVDTRRKLSAAKASRAACVRALRWSSPWLRNLAFVIFGTFSAALWSFIVYRIMFSVFAEHSVLALFQSAPSFHIPQVIESTTVFQRWKLLVFTVFSFINTLLVLGMVCLVVLGTVCAFLSKVPTERGPDAVCVPHTTPSKTPLFRKVFSSLPALKDTKDAAKVPSKPTEPKPAAFKFKLTSRRMQGTLFLLLSSLIAFPEFSENILGASSIIGLIPFAEPSTYIRSTIIIWVLQAYRMTILILIITSGVKIGFH